MRKYGTRTSNLDAQTILRPSEPATKLTISNPKYANASRNKEFWKKEAISL
jgi:hypothetical protein